MSDDVSRAAERRVGTTLRHKYRIDGVLGVGGMATVYAATHRNERRVAIKILHPELAVRAEIRERFASEGRAANRVRHPGAVAVIDDDTSEDGAPFLVMELLEGAPLDAVLAKANAPLPVEAVLAIGRALLDVLATAHDNGIVHRDIKPANLFLTTRGELKVLDFGIASVHDHAQRTKADAVLGTPAFMAPEVARGGARDADARTDVWAVGATLFTLLSGHLVHDGPSDQAAVIAAATVPAAPLRSVVPDAPDRLCEVVDRALRTPAEERWATARDMSAAVVRAQAEIFGREARVPTPSDLESGSLTTPARRAELPAPSAAAAKAPQPRARRAVLRLGLAVGAGVLGVVATATTIRMAGRTPRAAVASTDAGPFAAAIVPAPPASSAVCDGVPRVLLQCDRRALAASASPAGDDVAALDAKQRIAWRAIESQDAALADELREACEEYNRCVLDRATYVRRTSELWPRVEEVPQLLRRVVDAASDDARRAALGTAYRAVVPEPARTELRLEFSALVRRPGQLVVSPAASMARIPTGSGIAFSASVSRRAYVYIFERNTGGQVHVLFPDPKIAVHEPLVAGETLRIPQSGKAFLLDDKDLGEENVYLVASLHEVSSLADAVEGVHRGNGPSPVLDRVTSLEHDCPRDRGLELEDAASGDGCAATRGLSLEVDPGPTAPPSLSTVTEAADDTIATVYTFVHTP